MRRLMVFALLCTACSKDAAIAERAAAADPTGSDPGDAPAEPCTLNSQCPTAWTCEGGTCRPPEIERDRVLAAKPPAASPHYVYALNPSAETVARIDPRNLSIEAVRVGPEPSELVALAQDDVAVVLSARDQSLTLVDSTTLPSRVVRLPLHRPFTRLSVSADGAWAVLFPNPQEPPPTGTEGVVALVDLAGVRSTGGGAERCHERAAGYRITDVVFRLDSGRATRAFVFAKETVTIIDLATLDSATLPKQLPLPESMRVALSAREVIATPDGHHLILRATAAAELAYFDGTTIHPPVTLPKIATDLDLLTDGSRAVAAMREAGRLALIDLPADLLPGAPAGAIETVAVPNATVGQVVIPSAAPAADAFALVYTNASDTESFAKVPLAGTAAPEAFAVQKRVDAIAVSADGRSAIIVHRPSSRPDTSDPYETAVDRDEGYSLCDIASRQVQLRRTGTVKPGPFSFSPAGGWAAVALRDDATRVHRVDVLDLSSLVVTTTGLASAPLFLGPVPIAAGLSQHRIFVSQDHPAGRVSVVQLDTAEMRTVTGFTLNAEIE